MGITAEQGNQGIIDMEMSTVTQTVNRSYKDALNLSSAGHGPQQSAPSPIRNTTSESLVPSTLLVIMFSADQLADSRREYQLTLIG